MLTWLAKRFESRRAVLQSKLEQSIQSTSSTSLDYSEEWRKKGNTLLAEDDLTGAMRCYQKAVDADPCNVNAVVNLGFVKFETKQWVDARQLIERAIAIDSTNPDAWYIFGEIHEYDNDLSAAETAFRKAIKQKADFEQAYLALCRVLSAQNDLLSASEILKQGIDVIPHSAAMNRQLGNTFLLLGRLTEAIQSFRKAAALEPGMPEAFLNLGVALFAAGELDGAIAQYRIAIGLKPEYDLAYDNLGIALAEQGQTQLALDSFEQALTINPNLVSATGNIGSVRLSQARLDEAIQQYQKALLADPGNMAASSNLLFALNYHPELDAAEIYAAYQHFDQRFGAPLKGMWKPFDNNRLTSRRLRIGYVSPDFRHHSVMRFLEPILEHHNPHSFEIFAYAEVNKEDEVTSKAKTLVSKWRSTVGQTDDAVAKMIRDDQIDVLIDIAGHTGGNRLLVFARKPAPVSLSWLGYGYTTGLMAIDYYLTDEVTAPAGCESLFSESLWRMNRLPYVYRPDDGMGAEGPLPANDRGFITFGSLTRPIRINDRVIRVWAEILKQVPQSRLVVNSKSYGDAVTSESLATQFIEMGIDRSRLEIGYSSPPWDVLRNIDISLDCFPHNSGTTLFESLYMGVPYVTLAGRPSVGRIGASILCGLGEAGWVAYSESEYVNIAVKLAQDLTSLSNIRLTLRDKMKNSSIMDSAGFTRDLECTYRDMFEAWVKNEK